MPSSSVNTRRTSSVLISPSINSPFRHFALRRNCSSPQPFLHMAKQSRPNQKFRRQPSPLSPSALQKIARATICQQCGDTGFWNAWVYCVMCLEFAVHRYCLHKIPETFDEYVRWVCEDCSSEVQARKKLKRVNTSSFATEANDHKNHVDPSHDFVEPHTDPYRERAQLAGNGRRKDVTCSVGEGNELRHQRSPFQLERNCSQLKKKVMMKKKKMKKKKKKKKKKKNKKKKKKDAAHLVAKPEEQIPQRSASRRNYVAYGKMDFTEHAKLANGSTSINTKLKKTEDTCSVAKEEEHERCESSSEPGNAAQPEEQRRQSCSYQEHCVADSGIEKHGKDLELERESGPMLDKESNFNCEVPQVAISKLNVEEEHAQPVVNPVWRGTFSILNKIDDPFDGLVAHLSSKACAKVCDEASSLPSSLCVEMRPKFDVWPPAFRRSEPSDDNIALYFFPADTRHERIFDDLVDEMFSQELAMSAILKNSQLLVFTSIELPPVSRRFQGKYYLWGVFRSIRALRSHLVNYTNTKISDNGEYEQETDHESKAHRPLNATEHEVQ